MKKLLNKLKKQPVAPRAFPEIQKEYRSLSEQAGNVQYQIYAHTANLANVNKRLSEVHEEANARQKLDEEVKKDLEAKTQSTPKGPVAINPGNQTSGAV